MLHYVPEHGVLEKFPMLTQRELRTARRNKEIEWFAFREGPHYQISAVDEYIKRKYRKCPKPVSHTEITISNDLIQIEAVAGMPAPMTQEVEASGARACERLISRKRKTS